jgi:broad specificity phosphatase PhoE
MRSTGAQRNTADEWIASAKERTQHWLEAILHELLEIRAGDRFRELNPLAWTRAVKAN